MLQLVTEKLLEVKIKKRLQILMKKALTKQGAWFEFLHGSPIHFWLIYGESARRRAKDGVHLAQI